MNLFGQSADYSIEDAKGAEMNRDLLPVDLRRDELLAIRCKLGEHAAFEELIKEWAPAIRKYVLRMTNSCESSDDIMQEIWISVLQNIASLRECSKFRSWIFSIAHRNLMNRLRAHYSMQFEDQSVLEDISDENLEIQRDETRRTVESGLSKLPIAEREVLTLFYLQELTLAETADALLVPIGTIKSRLFRARELLRDQLIY